MKICFSCKRSLSIPAKIGRRDECPSCRADLHCCLNCAFYDPSAANRCREPVAEHVREKDKANFCDYFSFAESSGNRMQQSADQARQKLDDLFRR